MNNNLQFLAVGDITTDDFIDLKDVRIDKEPDPGDRGLDEICFRFGDKIEYESHTVVPAVGNSPNAAVSAHRLGLNSALMTDLGDDNNGKISLETLEEEGVGTEYVRVHEEKGTNYHYVLRFGPERTILVKHTEYEYEMPDISPGPGWLYLSSLGRNSLPFHGTLADYLEEHSETSLAFQPGTFQIELGYEKLEHLYKLSKLFFCNKEEARLILDTKEEDMKELLKAMRKKGPNKVVITDGPRGAYCYDGEEGWHMPMYPDPKEPVDRTGAGDAFSSTFTAATALGKGMPTALSWGPINSMSVVQYIGAQEGLLTREKLLEHLENAPEDYRAEKIM